VNGFPVADNSQPGLALCVMRTISSSFYIMRKGSLFRFLVSLLFAGLLRAGEPIGGARGAGGPVGSPLRTAEGVVTLTLEDALATVEGVNLDVLLSREAATQALQAVRQQRSTILPLVNGMVQQRRSQGVSIATVVVASGRPASRFDALITASYSLLDPELLSALKSARVGAEVAQANYRAVTQAVLADVTVTYFEHLRNLKRLDVVDANIVRARSLLTLARNQHTAGVATQIDVTRADAQLAVAEQARLQQETTVFESELLLKRLLDISPAMQLKLDQFRVQRANASLFAFAEQQTAFETRADYLAAQKAVEQARINVRTATFQRLPALALTGNYGLASANWDDQDKQEQWQAGIGISMPIFDGLRAGADRRIALSRQRSQEMRLHSLELQISSELRLAVQDAGSRNAQITVAEKSLGLAQEELRLAQQRYQQGVADNREVVEAQNRLANAEDGFIDAVFQYHLARVELARAKGDVKSVLAEKVP
jgi:outer membrane protein